MHIARNGVQNFISGVGTAAASWGVEFLGLEFLGVKFCGMPFRIRLRA